MERCCCEYLVSIVVDFLVGNDRCDEVFCIAEEHWYERDGSYLHLQRKFSVEANGGKVRIAVIDTLRMLQHLRMSAMRAAIAAS